MIIFLKDDASPIAGLMVQPAANETLPWLFRGFWRTISSADQFDESAIGGFVKTLIVYAHEEPHSFNAAMKNLAVSCFEEQGHPVVVSDLYRMKFKAVADGEDFLERRDKSYLKRQMEEMQAKLAKLSEK